jgi:hypothetical protein
VDQSLEAQTQEARRAAYLRIQVGRWEEGRRSQAEERRSSLVVLHWVAGLAVQKALEGEMEVAHQP